MNASCTNDDVIKILHSLHDRCLSLELNTHADISEAEIMARIQEYEKQIRYYQSFQGNARIIEKLQNAIKKLKMRLLPNYG